MFNRVVRNISLAKFLDEFVLPFVLLVWARYLGLFITSFILPIQFSFSLKFDLVSLPFVRFGGPEDLILANSVSWLFTGGVLAAVFGFTAFRAHHLHEDRLHPKEAFYLHNKKMEHLIISGYEALHQAISWAATAVTAFFISFSDFLFGHLSTFSFGVILSVCMVLVAALGLGIIRDVNLKSKKV